MTKTTLTISPPPYAGIENIIERASNIRLALFDVDGVLTDGSLHYHSDGELIKTFNVLDGHGLKMLQSSGIKTGIISAKDSPALRRRISDLNIEHALLAQSNKLAAYQQLLAETNLSQEQTCFTGDDVIDLEVMNLCGLAFSVANGHYSVKQQADWVTPMKGGDGAVRAICDILLHSQLCSQSRTRSHCQSHL